MIRKGSILLLVNRFHEWFWNLLSFGNSWVISLGLKKIQEKESSSQVFTQGPITLKVRKKAGSSKDLLRDWDIQIRKQKFDLLRRVLGNPEKKILHGMNTE